MDKKFYGQLRQRPESIYWRNAESAGTRRPYPLLSNNLKVNRCTNDKISWKQIKWDELFIL